MRQKIIYTISHPITKEVVYVGATFNLEQRALQHLHTKVEYRATNWIEDLLENGMTPIFTAIKYAGEDWREVEKAYINELIESGAKLFNREAKPTKKKHLVIVNNLIKLDLSKK